MAASFTNGSMASTESLYPVKHNVEMSWPVGDSIRATEGTTTR